MTTLRKFKNDFSWLIGLFALFFVAVPDASANEFKRIRDVNVACNNALSCDIYITNPRVTLQTFGFRRRASRDAQSSVYLSMREPLRAGTVVEFRVDGRTIVDVPVAELSYRAAIYEYSYRDEEGVSALLKAARRGDLLQINYTTKAGRSTAPFSLSGTTAGMIFADEVQGRIGRDDALMAITNVDAQNGDAAPALSTTEYMNWGEVPSALRAYFGTDNHLCSNEFGADDERVFGASAIELAGGISMVTMPCGSAGAYNFPSAFWVERDGIYTPMPLPVVTNEGLSAQYRVWNADWDGQSNRLASFFKGRGLGDCGQFYEWQLVNDGFDVAFILTDQKTKDSCNGVYREDFSDYEQIWPQ